MTIIRVVYEAPPDFPASDQHPAAQRHQVGKYWVDAVGGAPTQAEVDAFLTPPPPPKSDVDLLKERVATLEAQVSAVKQGKPIP